MINIDIFSALVPILLLSRLYLCKSTISQLRVATYVVLVSICLVSQNINNKQSLLVLIIVLLLTMLTITRRLNKHRGIDDD